MQNERLGEIHIQTHTQTSTYIHMLHLAKTNCKLKAKKIELNYNRFTINNDIIKGFHTSLINAEHAI